MRDPSPSSRRLASESSNVPQLLHRKHSMCQRLPAIQPSVRALQTGCCAVGAVEAECSVPASNGGVRGEDERGLTDRARTLFPLPEPAPRSPASVSDQMSSYVWEYVRMHTLLHPLHGTASSSSSSNGVPGGDSIASYIYPAVSFVLNLSSPHSRLTEPHRILREYKSRWEPA